MEWMIASYTNNKWLEQVGEFVFIGRILTKDEKINEDILSHAHAGVEKYMVCF